MSQISEGTGERYTWYQNAFFFSSNMIIIWLGKNFMSISSSFQDFEHWKGKLYLRVCQARFPFVGPHIHCRFYQNSKTNLSTIALFAYTCLLLTHICTFEYKYFVWGSNKALGVNKSERGQYIFSVSQFPLSHSNGKWCSNSISLLD